MKELINEIKSGNLQHVYLLFGDENYLKLQYRDRLLQTLLPDGGGMNLNRYEGDHIDEAKLIDQGETMPFFSDKRVILVSRSGSFKSGAERIVDYIRDMPDYLYLIFVEQEVDKRGRLFKAVKEIGRVVEFGEQKETTLQAWVLKLLSEENLKIRREQMDYLLERTGFDMNHIRLEVDKIICYCREKQIGIITDEIIDAVVTERVENRIFDMVACVTAHQRQQALQLYADLLSLKEPPMRILFLIGRQFHQLLIIKELLEEATPIAQIASKAGMPPFAVRKHIQQVKSYDKKTLQGCIAACVEAESDVKSGRMGDRLAVELILIRLSSPDVFT